MIYQIIKTYIKIGLSLFYKKQIISGKDNIPKGRPILFVANHQNAMMDPLIVACAIKKPLYFLARASAFKNKMASKFLTAIHAVAIYRVRDGVNSKALNEAVFKNCLDLFNTNKSILIFPEGSHHIKRQVRSLRSGFIRMTLDYLKANPKKDLIIIPVGLNYNNTINYAKSVHVIFGKPIYTRQFVKEDDDSLTKANLIDTVHGELKSLTVHIEDDNYQEQLNSFTEEDFLYPNKNQGSNSNKQGSKINSKTKKRTFFYYLMMLNSTLPFLVWKWLKPKVAAVEFISTAKFSLGLTVFPLFYGLQAFLVYHFLGSAFVLPYILLCFILVILSTKTR